MCVDNISKHGRNRFLKKSPGEVLGKLRGREHLHFGDQGFQEMMVFEVGCEDK